MSYNFLFFFEVRKYKYCPRCLRDDIDKEKHYRIDESYKFQMVIVIKVDTNMESVEKNHSVRIYNIVKPYFTLFDYHKEEQKEEKQNDDLFGAKKSVNPLLIWVGDYNSAKATFSFIK